MALYLDRNDVYELATDSLTDGKDDKKIDFIDLDIQKLGGWNKKY